MNTVNMDDLNAKLNALTANAASIEPQEFTPEQAAELGQRFNDLDGDGFSSTSESNWYLSAEDYQAYISAKEESVVIGWETQNDEAKTQAALVAEDIADSVNHYVPPNGALFV